MSRTTEVHESSRRLSSEIHSAYCRFSLPTGSFETERPTASLAISRAPCVGTRQQIRAKENSHHRAKSSWSPAGVMAEAQAKYTAMSAREKAPPARNDRPARCLFKPGSCSEENDEAKSSQESTCRQGEVGRRAVCRESDGKGYVRKGSKSCMWPVGWTERDIRSVRFA